MNFPQSTSPVRVNASIKRLQCLGLVENDGAWGHFAFAQFCKESWDGSEPRRPTAGGKCNRGWWRPKVQCLSGEGVLVGTSLKEGGWRRGGVTGWDSHGQGNLLSVGSREGWAGVFESSWPILEGLGGRARWDGI